MADGPARDAWPEALRMLSRRALTRAELIERLGGKGHGEEEAEQAAQRACELGWIDDRRIAERLAERWLLERFYGRRRAAREMLRRGLPEDMAEEALRALEERVPEVEADAIRKSRERWVSRHGEPESERDRMRLASHLQRRGFRQAMIRSEVLDR